METKKVKIEEMELDVSSPKDRVSLDPENNVLENQKNENNQNENMNQNENTDTTVYENDPKVQSEKERPCDRRRRQKQERFLERKKSRKEHRKQKKVIGNQNKPEETTKTEKSKKKTASYWKQNPTKARRSTIILDFGFSDLMTDKEISSLMHQIGYTYSANLQADTPFQIYATDINPQFEQHISEDSKKWLFFEHKFQPYIEAFQGDKDKLVYLTADSENVITEISPEKMYIVGAWVDRNRYKGKTKEKAQVQGIHTARLPIKENIELSTSCVLTVNQVVSIIIQFTEKNNWKEALDEVIPKRKKKSVDECEPAIGK